MASITLATLWLNLVSDLSDCQSFDYMTDKASSPQQTVELRKYAAGRTRAIATPGSANQLAVTLAACTGDQVAWLERNAGQLMLVRDDRGRKFFGIYTNPGGSDHQYDGDGDVALTLNEVTYDETV